MIDIDLSNMRPVTDFVHRKGASCTPRGARYIGRGSPYGNPFVIGRDGDRDAVCRPIEEAILPSLDLRPGLPARDRDPRLAFYRSASAHDLFSYANEQHR